MTAAAAPSGRVGSIALLTFSALILAPAILSLWCEPTPIEDRLQACAYSIVLWTVWLAIWGSSYRACLAATPLLIITPVAVYLLLAYHSQPTPAVIGIIAETDFEESSQFLRGLWLPVALAYGLTAATAIIALRLMHRQDILWRHRSRWWVLIMAPSAWCALFLLYQRQEAIAADLRPPSDPFRIAPEPLAIENLRNALPFGVVLELSDYLAGERNIAVAERALAGFRFGARQSLSTSDRQVYILVIGESARRDRWSLYGYARATSPQLQQESNLVSYSNVVTVATATRISVPVMLTRKPAEQALNSVFSERSLVSAFKEAGFTTYWLSTQAPVGLFDAPIAMYAKESDHLAYFNKGGGLGLTPPDGVMIDSLKRDLATASEARQLIVIHTLGSHYDYRFRYPPAFDIFKPSPSADEPGSLHDAAFRIKLDNAYDNSILYTDYFLSEVIAAVKHSDRPLAAMLYLSDHGEDLFDLACGEAGHGRATLTSYRIPFLFWYSDGYQRTFPRKIELLREHRDEPLTTQSVFPTMLDAADIHFGSEDLSRSLVSAAFTIHPRIVTTFTKAIDFDRAHLNKSCELEN